MPKTNCITHSYRQVNNRYKDGKQVIEDGEWVTETRCEKCYELLIVPDYLKEIYENKTN